MSTPKEPSLFGSNRFTMPGVIGPEHSINQSQLFVGRTQEKQSLLEHLNKSLTGEQRTVLLYGTSGLGKSELVKSFLREHVIPREGMIVLTGRCHEHESVSFKAFDQIIDTLSHLLMRLTKEDVISVVPQEVAFLTKVFPVLNRVDAINRYTQSVERGEDLPKIRSLAFGALRELFTRLCRLYHVVLFIDDLQWADEDSFLLLRALVAHPSPPALFTILARRTTSEEKDAHNELARVIEGIPAPVDLMPVLPLTNDESLELARRLSELEDIDAQTQGAGLIFMVGESGGHPLFIHELIRHAHNRERQKSGSPFLMLDDALWERISSLPTASRDILEIVSVSGASITIAALAQAANLAPEKLIMTVHQLCVANLLKTAGTDANKLVKPYHDRVRESVLKNLPPRTKRNWHKKLASIYSSLPGMKPDLLAFHYEGAVNLPMARRYLLEAARLADDLLAFDRAAKLYQKVISLWPAQNSHKETGLQEIWRDLGSTLANGGRNREAAHAYLKAVVGANPVEALEYQRLAGDLLMCSGHLDEGQEVINKVMQAHRVRIPKKGWRTLFSLAWRRLLLRLRGLSYRERDASQITTRELMRVDMFRSITSGMFFTDHVKGSELGTRWLHCALNVGEPGRILQALCLEVNFVSSSGKKEGSYQRRLFNTMETLLDKVNKPVHYGLVEVSRSLRHYMSGRWEKSYSHALKAQEILSNSHGLHWEKAGVNTLILWSLFYLGDLNEMSAVGQSQFSDAMERDDLFAASGSLMGLNNVVFLNRDGPQVARENLQRVMSRWSTKGYHLQHFWHLLSQVQIDFYCKEGEQAYQRLTGEWGALKNSLLLLIPSIRNEALSLRARCAIELARKSGVRNTPHLKTAQKYLRRLGAGPVPWTSALATVIHAEIHLLRGDEERGTLALRESIAEFDSQMMASYAASARLKLAGIIGGEEGTALEAQAQAHFKKHHIANPQNFSRMLIS